MTGVTGDAGAREAVVGRVGRVGSSVVLNADGVLVIDGKKTLPIGFTMPPPPEGKTPTGKNAIEELQDAGATFLRTGPMGTDWDEAAFAQEQKYEDAAARYGMHCLVNLREAASFPPGDTVHEALLRRLIARFKDHPGMGVWKHVDEPEWGHKSVADMMRASQLLRTLDPHHPIEVTQAPRGTVESLKPYNVTSDIVGVDIYPISYPPGTHSLLPNKEISLVGDYARIMRQVADDRMPFWMTLQIAWSGVVKPGKTLRFPTYAEERFMTFEALIYGARGLLFFGGHLPAACTPEDAARGWNWHFWNTVLRPVIQQIGTKSPLYPALLAPDSRYPITVHDAKGIEFCIREVGDDVFVLACKREGATEQASFRGLPADCIDGEVLYESPRHLAVKEGVFTDWFAPFDVHVYRFHRAPTAALLPSPRPNPSARNGQASELPSEWGPLTLGAPAQFARDNQILHEGRQTLRITAAETTRAYLRTATPIPVAPGERLQISAWVRSRDVPKGQGTVIAIAEFGGVSGAASEPLVKVGVASDASADWEKIANAVTVPPLATTLRLRLGFSYSHGTCWWDDVRVEPEQPLVLRVDLSGLRLSPSEGGVPVLLLNRQMRRGSVQVSVSATGKSPVRNHVDVTLTGEPAQSVLVPLTLARPGKVEITGTLQEPGHNIPLFTATRSAVVPPPLLLSPPLPTHWAIEDGAPSVTGTVDVAVPSKARDGARLTVRLRDSGGAVCAEWTNAAAVADGFNSFSLRLPKGLPLGDYQIAAELGSLSRPAIGQATQPWHILSRRQYEVTLNSGGYLEQNGQAIFPLGVFNGNARLSEMGAAGFTVTHAYNALRMEPGDPRPDDQRAMDFLDTTEKAGMKALFMVPMKLAIANDWDGFRQRIRRFRNHPALLAWEEEEGLARGDMKRETLAKIRAVLHEEDPYHPFLVGDSRDVIGRVVDRADFFPLSLMDLGMWWWYPLPVIARSDGGALSGDETAGQNGELTPPTFLIQRRTDKPLWVGVQSYKKPGLNNRYPTPIEYRAQAYIALIEGAKGLLWYGGSVTGGLYLSPVAGHWDYLQTLVRELHDLASVFMYPTAERLAFVPASAPVSIALKRMKNRSVLFVVNRGVPPLALSITLPPSVVHASSAHVLNENRTVPIADGKIDDRFDTYAVHVYELVTESAQ